MVQSLILKKQDRGEADELVIFFSRELGWLRGIAKNSKKSRIRFGGHLEPFSLVDLTLRQRKRDDLVWIDEAQVLHGHLGIRSDIGKVAWASYFLELASMFLPEDSPDQNLFDFLHEILEELDKDNAAPDLLSVMLDTIRLLGFVGFSPRFDSCTVCGKIFSTGQEAVFSPALGGICHRECLPPGLPGIVILSPGTLAVIRQGLKLEGEAAKRLRLHKKGLNELAAALAGFIRYLHGGEIPSLYFLEKLGLWPTQ